MLRRSRGKQSVVHTADAYLTVLNHIFSRAGLQLTTSAPSARSTSVNPKFAINPSTNGHEAAHAALAFLADRIIMRTLCGAQLTEPLVGAATAFHFGEPPAFGFLTAHPLRSVELLQVPPRVTQAQAFGLALVFGESIDFTNALQTIGTIDEQRDVTSTGAATAAATAVAHLRQRALDTAAGVMVAPPHCGLELYDAIDFIDALVSAATVKRRVAGLRWRYDRHRAIYEQTITLGAM